MSCGRSTRDPDTYSNAARRRYAEAADEERRNSRAWRTWLDALSEIYMNKLDNRARWEPRWLNVTSRERFEGLASVRIAILDYFGDSPEPRSTSIGTKQQLAAALQERPDGAEVRVVMVSGLSRFVMGALGRCTRSTPSSGSNIWCSPGTAQATAG